MEENGSRLTRLLKYFEDVIQPALYLKTELVPRRKRSASRF